MRSSKLCLKLFITAITFYELNVFQSCANYSTQPKPEDSFATQTTTISSSLFKAMSIQEQIVEYMEQTDTGRIDKKDFNLLTTPMQNTVDSIYKKLSPNDAEEFDDYKLQLLKNLVDRKAKRMTLEHK